MTKEIANEIEAFLTEKLHPKYGFILMIGNPGEATIGFISNYAGEELVIMLKELANIAYAAKPGENN